MDPASLEFARPVWLYAGGLVCVLAGVLWIWFDRRREADLGRLVHARFRARLLPGLSRGLLRWKRGLWLAGVLLLCSAAAGPQMGHEWREVRQRGIDILFAVDTSRSMLAEDLSPNRLERARMGIQDFVERLHGDRVGLIPFAGSSFVMCPLTTDYDAFRDSLRALETDLIPRQGTDVASAIREAKRIFEEQKNNHRVLVLMTDGEDFQGDVEAAVKEAKEDGMTVHTVGVGSAEGGRIPLIYPNGQRDFVRDEEGSIVQTRLDEASLRKIAEGTGGLFAPLGRGAEGLELIYREKLRLVPQEEREARMEKVPLERYGWPLAAGLLLLVVEFLLPGRRRETKGRVLPSVARRHVAAVLILVAGSLLCSEAGAEEDPRALYNEGTAAYETGDFAKAASSLRACLKTTDLKLQSQAYYNLGNALYRSGQAAQEKDPDKVEELWTDAQKAYDDALALNAGDDDARYNRDLVKRKLEEWKKQKDGSGEKGEDDKKKDDGKKGEEKGEEQKKGQSNDPKDEKEGGKEEQPAAGREDKQEEGKDAEVSEGKEGGEKQPEGRQDEKSGESTAEQKDGEQAYAERRKPGEMTPEEARQLLKTLRSEEATVLPFESLTPRERRFSNPKNSTRGKTW
jgi:Ca-activated chloride channel family protein